MGNETKMATRTSKRSILTILRKKKGDCEQSIDISKFKIIETQFDRILAKSKTKATDEFSIVIHSLSNTTT